GRRRHDRGFLRRHRHRLRDRRASLHGAPVAPPLAQAARRGLCQRLSWRSAAGAAPVHLLLPRRIRARRARDRGGGRRSSALVRRLSGGDPARRAQRRPARPGGGGGRARIHGAPDLAARPGAAGPAHFGPAAHQRIHPAAQGLLARLRRRHRRAHAGQHEHRLDDLPAPGSLCRRRPFLPRDQSYAGGLRRARGTAPRRGRDAMSLDVLWRYLPSLTSGFGVTIVCWSVGGALGMALGFAIALLRRLRLRPLRWALRAYIEVFRGTPFLVQLFLLYSAGPSVGLRLSATEAGLLGLGLYSSAYFAEIFRAGFGGVPAGQIEAATSIGMSKFDTLIRVELPAALIAAVPAIVNMLIVLSKETVVLSIITVPELMYQMQTMAAETFTAFDAIFAMAVFYWILVEAVSRL